MNKIMLYPITALFLFSVILAGCNETITSTQRTIQPTITPLINITDNIDYLLTVSHSKQNFLFPLTDSTSQQFDFDYSVGGAIFGSTYVTPPYRNAGAVYCNNSSLIFVPDSTYQGEINDLQFNGSKVRWSVAGAGSIPSIVDSILIPNSKISISSPSVGQVISRSNGFTVMWNTTSESDLIARLEVLPMEPDTNGSAVVAIDSIPNTGSYSVSSSLLQNLDPGRARVVLRRGRYKIATASNSKKYLMIVWSEHQIDIKLQ